MPSLSGQRAIPNVVGVSVVTCVSGSSTKRIRVFGIYAGSSSNGLKNNAGFPGGTSAGYVGPWMRLSYITPLVPAGVITYPNGILLDVGVALEVSFLNPRGESGWVVQALYDTVSIL